VCIFEYLDDVYMYKIVACVFLVQCYNLLQSHTARDQKKEQHFKVHKFSTIYGVVVVTTSAYVIIASAIVIVLHVIGSMISVEL